MRLPRRDLDEVVSQRSAVWEEVRGAKILVTGATGFVGRWLIETFAHANAVRRLGGRILALSREPDSLLEREPHLGTASGITWIRADFEAEGSPSRPPESCDLAIHAAGPAAVALSSGGREGISRTVEGALRAFDFAVRAGARRFLYLSSGAVYGRRPDTPLHVTEDFPESFDPGDPVSAYAETKVRGERLCLERAQEEGIAAVVARGFSFLGPLLPLGDKFAAGSFLEDVLKGGPVRVHGDGTPLRSYLHAGDMSAWLWTMLVRGAPGRAYNVGSERAVSIAELARTTASLADPPLPVQVEGLKEASRAAGPYVPSTQRARTELGLEETLDWRESLRRTHEWHQKQPMPATAMRASR